MESQFVLSKPVIQGLKHLGTDLSVDLSKQLIDSVIKVMLNPEKNTTSTTDTIVDYGDNQIKTLAEYAIVTVLTEATKHCCDSFTIRQILEEHSIDIPIIDHIEHVYEENRKKLTLQQLLISQHFPHITEVQWRIMSDIKSSTSDKANGEVSFQINLGRYKEDGEYETVVEFLANTEELQSILGKLKEIERHCEKFSNE